MKRLPFLIFLALMACAKSELVSEFTGNETTYALQQGSAYAVSGTVTLKERKDGQVTAVISLNGTDGNSSFPAHLHFGDISQPGADVMLLFTPVRASSGTSQTTFNKLSDETAVNYASLLKLDACIKIHMGDTGPARDIILAAGNIGNSSTRATGGRVGVGVCKSE